MHRSKHMLAIVACAALSFSPARAADMPIMALAATSAPTVVPMPVKASPATFTYPYTGSGWYAGAGALTASTSPTVNGTTQNSLQAFGAAVGGDFGYRWGNGSYALALEASAFYDNIGGATSCSTSGCQIAAKFTSIERAKLIIPASVLTAALPTICPSCTFPTLPNLGNLTFTGQHVYVWGGFKVDDVSAAAGVATGRAWQFAPGGGLGFELQTTNAIVVDFWTGYFNPSNGFGLGLPASFATQGRSFMAGVNFNI